VQRATGLLGNLAEKLGLKRDASDKDIIQGLVNKVDKVFEGSKEISKARRRYNDLSQQLEDKGILHVVTAGNMGSAARRGHRAWEPRGLNPP
jgi:hypothetical protein